LKSFCFFAFDLQSTEHLCGLSVCIKQLLDNLFAYVAGICKEQNFLVAILYPVVNTGTAGCSDAVAGSPV
jgi:hypothetical protein